MRRRKLKEKMNVVKTKVKISGMLGILKKGGGEGPESGEEEKKGDSPSTAPVPNKPNARLKETVKRFGAFGFGGRKLVLPDKRDLGGGGSKPQSPKTPKLATRLTKRGADGGRVGRESTSPRCTTRRPTTPKGGMSPRMKGRTFSKAESAEMGSPTEGMSPRQARRTRRTYRTIEVRMGGAKRREERSDDSIPFT